MRRSIAIVMSVVALSAIMFNRALQPGRPDSSPHPISEQVASAWNGSAISSQRPRRVPASSDPVSPADWTGLQIGERIEFTLPSLERYVGVVTEERQGRVSTSFSGNLDGDRRFHFTLTTGPSERFGTINTPVGVFEIATVGNTTWFYPREPFPLIPDLMDSDAVKLQPRLVLKRPMEVRAPPTFAAP